MTSPLVANPTIASAPTPIPNNARWEHNKKVLTYLGIVEFVIGSLAILFSGVTVGYMSGWLKNELNKKSPFTDCNGHCYPFTIGEGIWCGVWVLIGGALGIASGRKRSTPCLIYCHMGFSIVGAVSSGVLLSIGIVIALVNRSPLPIVFEILLIFGGFVTLTLCIVSTVYCCKTAYSAGWNTCCGTCCTEEVIHVGVGQTMYVGISQRHQQVQQTVVQTQFPNRTNQHEPYYGNIGQAMQTGEAAGHQPMFVAQQQRAVVSPRSALVAQQHHSSSSDPSKHSETQRKQQEIWNSPANAATSAKHSDTPPSYFQNV